MTDDDIVRRLRDAYTELRTLPLGGRGHLADVCHEGAGEITELRATVEQLNAENARLHTANALLASARDHWQRAFDDLARPRRYPDDAR